MPHLSNWLTNAESKSDVSLIAFNFRNCYGPDKSQWQDDILGRFNEFLGNRKDEDFVTSLSNFSKFELRRPPQEAAAYSGRPVKSVSEFRALKPLAAYNYYGLDIGLPKLDLTALHDRLNHEISSVEEHERFDRKDQFTNTVKSRLFNVLKQHISQAKEQLDPRRGESTGDDEGSLIHVSSRPTGPIWLTVPDEIYDGPSDDAHKTEAVAISLLAAGLKSVLGLDSGRDSERYTDRAAYEDGSAFKYRILVFLSVALGNSNQLQPTQPNIFSDGYHYLFTYRSEENITGVCDMPGQTVRLSNKKCNDHGDSCLCGAPGVPEAIAPQEEIYKDASVSVIWAGIVFGEHLTLKPAECEMIRKKNPYHTPPKT